MKTGTFRNVFKKVLVLIVVGAIAAYAYATSAAFIKGPVLTLTHPSPLTSVAPGVLAVRGTAAHVAYLSLNGRQIFTNEHGVFNEELLVPKGYTIIAVEARDRFGRITKETITLYASEKNNER